jgi:hypothetical protein
MQTNAIQLTRTRLFVVAAVVCLVVIGVAIGAARAADPRLDEADAALQKAQALLEASQPGVASEKAQRRFARAVARAVADVEDARAEIAIAKDAVDNP